MSEVLYKSGCEEPSPVLLLWVERVREWTRSKDQQESPSWVPKQEQKCRGRG